MPHTIVHFEIYGDDVPKLAEFYRKLFGWNIQKVPMGGEDYWMVETIATDPSTGFPKEPGVNGGMMKRPMPGQTHLNYIQVESVDEYSQKVAQLGGKVVAPKQAIPQIGYFAVAVDPQGNPFGVFQEDRTAK